MKIVFWNIARNNISNELSILVETIAPDILFIAEVEMSESAILISLNKSRTLYFYNPDPACRKIKMFSKFHNKYVAPVNSSSRYTVRRVTVPTYVEFNLMCLHYQSKVNWDLHDQAANSSDWRTIINDFESKTHSFETLIIGDFNMNPFDFGMVQTTGFHSVMSKDVALKNSRVVDGKDYMFFYNPMWSFYGDHGKGKVNGTMYNALSKPINYFWNMFDQVLIRPNLINHIDESEIQIITNLGSSKSLIKSSGIVDKSISDHLPISITIKHNQNA